MIDTYGALSEDVREFLEAHNKDHGWGTDIDVLIETLTDARDVHREKVDDARWWYDENVVTELDGMYILYPWAVSTRDMSAQESGWEMDLNMIRFVTPVEKTITVYE